MKTHRLCALFVISFFLTGTCFGLPVRESLTKRRALSDLDTIHSIFEVKYAPLTWKGEFANWELNQSIQNAKNKIDSLPNPSLKDCQIIIRDFFNSTLDYHVGICFHSTESASLPFLVKGAEKRYFICDVDQCMINQSRFPFEVGDEILAFDRRPVHEVIEELRLREYGSNTYETDLALAELTLTNRRSALGHVIPKGEVVIIGKKKGEDKERVVKLKWDYIPEKIRDLSKLGRLQTSCYEPSSYASKSDLKTALRKSQFFEKLMVFQQWDCSYAGTRTEVSKHALGSRDGFLPSLGEKTWESGSDWNFSAYIFQTANGKKVGYVRIPHYMADVEELDEFGAIMNYFQKRTDALIIDQLNNPGGSVFYLYALVSTLIDKPIYAPKHHITLTQDEVHRALYLLPYLEQVKDDATARTVLGDEVGGYPVDFEYVNLMKKFCHFLVDQWNEGKLFTEPTHLYGVDKIKPHPRYRYSKPILLLINSLDFSGGDFFPAIMQDNKRATLMGTRTSGAGGYVLVNEFPNHTGIMAFQLTGSIAKRINKKPIENLGVKPEIPYELTVEDLQGDYQHFADAIVEVVESLKK